MRSKDYSTPSGLDVLFVQFPRFRKLHRGLFTANSFGVIGQFQPAKLQRLIHKNTSGKLFREFPEDKEPGGQDGGNEITRKNYVVEKIHL